LVLLSLIGGLAATLWSARRAREAARRADLETAKAARVSDFLADMFSASLYAAFGDKKAMYVAALERLWGNIDKQFAALEAADLPLGESIARILKGSIDAYTAGPVPQGCLAICTATAEAAGDAEIREKLDRVLDLMDERIERFYARAGHDPDSLC